MEYKEALFEKCYQAGKKGNTYKFYACYDAIRSMGLIDNYKDWVEYRENPEKDSRELGNKNSLRSRYDAR